MVETKSPLYTKARFLCATLFPERDVPDVGWEVAFAGRSNAGKSSAVNAITGQKNLARTSKTPGRTQQLIFFELDERRRLVDLPGYGYAKVPKRLLKRWQERLVRYLQARESLSGVVIVMDIRHPMTPVDRAMLELCESAGRRVHVLLTKADKLGFGKAKETLRRVEAELKKCAIPTSVQLFSATERIGIEEACQLLDHWLGVEEESKSNQKNPEAGASGSKKTSAGGKAEAARYSQGRI